MSYLVLARKYRSQTLAQVVGQNHVTQTLANAIAADRVAHAILLAGPRGTGKTTIARILAKAMNCVEGPTPIPCNRCRSCVEITNSGAVDVFEIDGASNNGVDQVRELRENIRYMPSHSKYKIYIIDEVHMLSLAAFNALLKTLEEPPEHVMFIFATTEPQKIPITILSRCQRHDLRRIDNQAITNHMATICEQEGVAVDSKSLWAISREAGGCMRDALSLLDQIISCSDGSVTQDEVLGLLGILDREMLFDTSRAIIERDIAQILAKIEEIHARGVDMRRFFTDLIEHFRNLMVVALTNNATELLDLPDAQIEELENQAKGISPAFLNQVLDLFFKEEATLRYSASPKLALEVIFLRLFQMQPALPIEVLIEKIDTLRKGIGKAPVTPSEGASTSDLSGQTGQPAPLDESALGDEPTKDRTGSGPHNSAPHHRAVQTPAGSKAAVQRVVAEVSAKKPSLGASLAKCTLAVDSAGALVVTVNANEYTLNTVKKHAGLIKTACTKVFGTAMEVSIQAKIDPRNLHREKKSRANRLKNEALAHPLVTDAIELFDGKVVDVKVLEEEKRR